MDRLRPLIVTLAMLVVAATMATLVADSRATAAVVPAGAAIHGYDGHARNASASDGVADRRDPFCPTAKPRTRSSDTRFVVATNSVGAVDDAASLAGINGRSGTYEIFTRPSLSGRTEVVQHRFFRPDPL